MNRLGFEALADGVMLLTVLLVGSTIVLSLAGTPDDSTADAAKYAEDTRLALFRTTLDGLAFTQGGREVALANGTSVETYLRLQLHLRRQNVDDLDFRAANERLTVLARALVRPGWTFAVIGRTDNGPVVVTLPADVDPPEAYAASNWSHPPMDGSGPDTVLSLLLWLSPHR
jgi:hypothetical protein